MLLRQPFSLPLNLTFFLGPVYPSPCFARSIPTLVAYNLVLMKLIALIFSLVALTAGAHAQHQHHYRRQVELAAVPTSSSSSTTRSAVGSPSSSPASGTNPAPSSTTTSSPGSISTGSSYTTNASPSSATSVPTGLNGVPPLSLISSGMSTGTSSPLASTYTPGATPPIPGAPPLPTTCTSSRAPPHSLTQRLLLKTILFSQSWLTLQIGRRKTNYLIPVSRCLLRRRIEFHGKIQVLRRYSSGCRNSWVSIYPIGHRRQTVRARVTRQQRRSRRRAAGGRVVGSRVTRISPRVPRYMTGELALTTVQAGGVGVFTSCLSFNDCILISCFIAQSAFIFVLECTR